jgi:energy-coupling factor transporter transmembrane protein EcfT
MKKQVQKDPSLVKKVFSTIFFTLIIIIGVISILTSIAGFSRGLIIFGSLYLILGVFAFFPKKIIKISNGKKLLIVLSVFIILLILSIIFNWSTSEEIFNHDLQEEFILDGEASNISVIIYNTTKATTIILNNQEKTTTGYFLFINCELINLGKSAVTLNPIYDIIDNQNKTYAGMGFSSYQESFQPDLKKQIYFLFEIPTSAEELKFRIRDQTGLHIINLVI